MIQDLFAQNCDINIIETMWAEFKIILKILRIKFWDLLSRGMVENS